MIGKSEFFFFFLCIYEMASGGGDEEVDAVLSDVKEGDKPVSILIKSLSAKDVLEERFRELLAELDRES